MHELYHLLTKKDIVILFLTETWLLAEGVEPNFAVIPSPTYVLKSIPPSEEKGGDGIRIIFKSDYTSKIISTEQFSNFLNMVSVHIRLLLPRNSLNFVCMYLSQIRRFNRTSISNFLDDLTNKFSSLSAQPRHPFLIKDFNIHLDDFHDRLTFCGTNRSAWHGYDRFTTYTPIWSYPRLLVIPNSIQHLSIAITEFPIDLRNQSVLLFPNHETSLPRNGTNDLHWHQIHT